MFLPRLRARTMPAMQDKSTTMIMVCSGFTGPVILINPRCILSLSLLANYYFRTAASMLFTFSVAERGAPGSGPCGCRREACGRRRCSQPTCRVSRTYNFTRFSLSELVITETELKLIAAAAIIGDSSMPKNGNSTPAAIGTPAVL